MNDSLERALGRVEGRVEMVLGKIDVFLETQEAHDKRITKLEDWKAGILGGAAVLGFIGAALAKVLF